MGSEADTSHSNDSIVPFLSEMSWLLPGKVYNDDDVLDLTELLDVVLLPGDVQEEHLLVLVLREDLLLYPEKKCDLLQM